MATPAEIVTRAHVPVLCYHQIRAWKSSDSAAARSLTTPPEMFARQMDVLMREGYETI